MTRPRFLLCFIVPVLVILGFAPVASAHYAPDLGRWVERDPIGTTTAEIRIGQHRPHRQYKDGMNLYQYSKSKPVIMVDPFGLCGITLGASDEVWDRLNKGRDYQPNKRMACCGSERYYPDSECCDDGKVVAKVSIWVCTRPLDPSGVNFDLGPAHHAFILCKPPQHGKLPRDPSDTTYDDDGFYGFGKQPRQLFEAWDCENNRPILIAPPPDAKKPWAEGPGYVDWETYPVDATRCSEARVCPKDKERMCKRGPTKEPYEFLSTNCQRWAKCLGE